MNRRIAAALVLGLALAGFATPSNGAATGCTPDPGNHEANDADPRVQGTAGLPGGYGGFYAVPAGATALVVMMHGYDNDASSWVCHIIEASEHGVAAFALDYPLQAPQRGWRVQEGATASLALTSYFLQSYSALQTVVVFGVSMGGNASGLAVADSKDLTKPNGDPLVDYWFDIEGVTNLREEYLLARAVGNVNVFARNAADDMEEEAGGSLAEQPEAFSRLTVVDRVPDIVASGVEGIVIVHGIFDGLVPYNQSRELQAAVLAQSEDIGIDFYTVGGRGSGEAGTTPEGNVLNPAGQGGADPFAGHAWEGSDTHAVNTTAFGALWALLDDGDAPGDGVTRNAEILVNVP